MKKIAIIDYGLGNLRSAKKGLEYASAEVIITKDPDDINSCDGVVLPGVGAFKSAMENIKPVENVIAEFIQDGKPLLGICLGMQMLLSESEEGGSIKGLDIVPGKVIRFNEDKDSNIKIPHMGWNSISIQKKHVFLKGIKEGSFVYFVHSYYVASEDRFVLASTDYVNEFASIVVNEDGNVIGTQFHPEKSGATGLKMLKNFVSMC